jgi:dsDNA-binding SOS-regulon protein
MEDEKKTTKKKAEPRFKVTKHPEADYWYIGGKTFTSKAGADAYAKTLNAG